MQPYDILLAAARMARTEISRRTFAARAARSLLGVGLLPGFLDRSSEAARADEAQTATAKRVIYLYMTGGQSQLDTWNPKDVKDVAGPVKTIGTSADGIRVTEYLPRTAKQMHHATVVNSMTSNQGAHEQGVYFMHTSFPPRGTIQHPGMGAWLEVLQPGKGHDSLPNYVYVGNDSLHPGAGFFPAAHGPLFVNNPANGVKNIKLPSGIDDDRFAKRLSLASDLDRDFDASFPQKKLKTHAEMYDGAIRMMRSKDLEAFELAQEPEALRKSYGDDPFGQGCLLARRLVERGVRFVEVSQGGWDTHALNFARMPDLCDVFDRGYATLLQDLHDRGMLADTLVVVATEFGRTPDINMNVGRDHYPQAFSCVLAGGGIRGGHVHGKTSDDGREIVEDEVDIPSFNATIAHALGLPLKKEVMSPDKRPFTLADKGKPVLSLFA